MKKLLVLAAVSLACVACKTEVPGPAGSGVAPTTEGQLPAGHPATGMPGLGNLPTPPSGEIVGQLTVADAVKDKVAVGDTIFVMARNAATGSLVAVVRLDAPAAFPLSFTLTGGDVMHQQTALAGKVKLEARVDKDRDAMTKNPGDVFGETTELVVVPATGVSLVLDRLL